MAGTRDLEKVGRSEAMWEAKSLREGKGGSRMRLQ